VILAMVASVEAIFLSTFILISQNRMTAAADKRADLDLQINLLAEHEVTKLVALVSALADRVGIKTEVDAEVEELKQDVAPEAVLDEIGRTETISVGLSALSGNPLLTEIAILELSRSVTSPRPRTNTVLSLP
jgi:uncharacterized membrane protein